MLLSIITEAAHAVRTHTVLSFLPMAAMFAAILKNEVEHRARGVLELLCKKNLVQ